MHGICLEGEVALHEYQELLPTKGRMQYCHVQKLPSCNMLATKLTKNCVISTILFLRQCNNRFRTSKY